MPARSPLCGWPSNLNAARVSLGQRRRNEARVRVSHGVFKQHGIARDGRGARHLSMRTKDRAKLRFPCGSPLPVSFFPTTLVSLGGSKGAEHASAAGLLVYAGHTPTWCLTSNLLPCTHSCLPCATSSHGGPLQGDTRVLELVWQQPELILKMLEFCSWEDRVNVLCM